MTFSTAYFKSGDLVPCYRPPRLSEVYEGNHVMLASGGPCMIVSEVKGRTIVCKFEDDDKKVVTMNFDIATLTCYGAK